MGLLKVTLCTGAALAAALTPAAHAAGDGGVSVTPSTPVPGTDVTLRVTDCAERTAVAASPAFVADVRLSGGDGTLVGAGRVRSTLPAGTYDVEITCGVTDRTVPLTVAGRSTAPAPARPSAPASPARDAEPGGGGAVHPSAADAGRARTAGPGAGHTTTGLVLAGAAAVAVALGGARRGREAG
ncbi:hypothetical protein [Streptomyces glaucus]|uniref:Secreted protein n=1 Tax=Streptomyces glaucus TaxID=284029 RepID=A0ABN3J1I8_9ACTN